jgi:uridine kinase
MRPRPYFVGIAGGSGSGKTSLIRALGGLMPEGSLALISQDDYYRPKEQQAIDANGRVNFDLPGAVDLDGLQQDMQRLAEGRTIYRTEYTFNQAGMEPGLIEVPPAPIVMVEGLFVLHHSGVRDLFDLKVFVDTSEESQLQRRLKRDAEERGYGADEVLYQWEHHVMPAYRTYLLPYRHLCDIHVMNETGFERALQVLHDHLLRESVVRNGVLRAQEV